MNWEIPDVQAGFRKGRGTRFKLPTSVGPSKKQESSEKHLICGIDYAKTFDCMDHNCGKFFKRWEYQTTWPASWEICMQVKKQQLELDMEQQTGSKSGKEYVKAVYCHSAYLTYMQCTSQEMLNWMNHKLESRLLGEISITSDTQMIWCHPYGKNWKRTKEPPDESERGEWKGWLKAQHSEN